MSSNKTCLYFDVCLKKNCTCELSTHTTINLSAWNSLKKDTLGKIVDHFENDEFSKTFKKEPKVYEGFLTTEEFNEMFDDPDSVFKL